MQRRATLTITFACFLLTFAGCKNAGDARVTGGAAPQRNVTSGATIQSINLSNPVRAVARDEPIVIAAARNEWISFALHLNGASLATSHAVRLRPLTSAGASIPAGAFEVSQVVSMPIDVNPGYTRHTGLNTAARTLPRALLPVRSENGIVDLKNLRPPDVTGKPLLLWVDLHVPADAQASEYTAACDLVTSGRNDVVGSVPIKLNVYDFVLPQERHLQVIGQVSWDRLKQHYADRFQAVRPRLINRREPRYQATVRTLDQVVALAQRNRVAVVVPGLQPTVKWPTGELPQIDWRDFDSLVGPWMKGSAFDDQVALNYWALPAPEILDRYDTKSRLDYWALAATHFDQNGWLSRAAVSLEKITPGRATSADALDLSAEAAQILAVHPRIRVTLPLEDEQIRLATPDDANVIDPGSADRVLASAPGLVSTPAPAWPESVPRPEHWLRTDLPGLVPYVGAGGDERDVRLWAWLAFLRHADLVLWNSTLPTVPGPDQPADPNELTWFYPGSWFGLDEPVPTIQLKWLRRAQQDYEYLWLARERGEVINALLMARLITKPVEIQPNQAPDPAYSLMTGTTDPAAWNEAQQLLAQTILLRKPSEPADDAKQRNLYIQTLQWARPQEKPLLMGRTTEWSLSPQTQQAGNWLNLKLGVDIYNASDDTPDKNLMRWDSVPPGWRMDPHPLRIPVLRTYHVHRTMLDASFDLNKLTPGARQPATLSFIDGHTQIASPLKLQIPLAACDRHEGLLQLDGRLQEWDTADLLHDGPLLQMLNRPGVQKQELQPATTASKIYSGWSNDDFLLAFHLEGLMTDVHEGQNFVNYQSRRAWGEDLCELLIQPVDSKNNPGPVLHIVCKPHGAELVERKVTPHSRSSSPWQTVEGGGVRYHATTPGAAWQGELAIPWRLITGPDGELPTLLRFNFAQYRAATGESASWAGPIDFGRDDSFLGVLYLRNPDPGVAQTVPERSTGDR